MFTINPYFPNKYKQVAKAAQANEQVQQVLADILQTAERFEYKNGRKDVRLAGTTRKSAFTIEFPATRKTRADWIVVGNLVLADGEIKFSGLRALSGWRAGKDASRHIRPNVQSQPTPSFAKRRQS